MYNEEIKYDSDFTKNSSTYNADEFFCDLMVSIL